ncbi:type III-A CRISPR-associated RAMP protein Csm5 [Desulfobulbus alkaliphilus]|uniref:type III-A CRISPR-associated RAMP protein Csm5 n=1 Tax=Desulfobulbus alkaliphilus TaxID=869814 RepID=UPI0019668456|nr:type III-A CRISPR-associated RAMP protein Csm5 [Desulfobulbus alkaliphilus]MBM9536302.1 type III-A CRISPR-associated RAMP protein Csm5 [Desulfobulbus alkaliphilus]
MKFMEICQLAVTPLSPIHIGCGEDFEPTNYVIDSEKKQLYGFDPGKTVLPDTQAQKLTELAESANLLGIQRFFRDNRSFFIPYSQVVMPVADGVASDYHNKIGKVANLEGGGRQVFNQFAIERHIHSRNRLYIPGSSLKGALRTALMDRLNKSRPIVDRDEKRNSGKLAVRLLGGDFATSPLRLLKVADCMPSNDIDRQILYAVNRYKLRKYDRKTGQEKEPRGVVARKEVILPGQYRAFTGTITVHDLGDRGLEASMNTKRNVPRRDMRPELAQVARDCNEYHRPRLREELRDMVITGMIDPKWKADIEGLLDGELKPLLDAGKAMLVRLGKYGGAESKTLTGVAEIKIMKGKAAGKQEFEFLNKTKTFWFAAPKAEQQKEMLPFGWVLVEITPQGELPQLKAWCDQQVYNRPNMKTEYEQLAATRLQAEHDAQKIREQMQAEERARQEREAERQRREDEIKKFPWREHLPQLEKVENWGDLQQAGLKFDDAWKNEVEVASVFKMAAERVRTNFPKTWSVERDEYVVLWLAASGLEWSSSEPVITTTAEDGASAPDRISDAGFKNFGDWTNRSKQLGLEVENLSAVEVQSLQQLFKEWKLDNKKAWKKNPGKKEYWDKLHSRIKQLKVPK